MYNTGWAINTSIIEDDSMEKIRYGEWIVLIREYIFSKINIEKQQDNGWIAKPNGKNNQMLIKSREDTIDGCARIANLMENNTTSKKQ